MSDAQIEYHIKDRTSFRDFLGIQSVDDVPDGKGPKKKGVLVKLQGVSSLLTFHKSNATL